MSGIVVCIDPQPSLAAGRNAMSIVQANGENPVTPFALWNTCFLVTDTSGSIHGVPQLSYPYVVNGNP